MKYATQRGALTQRQEFRYGSNGFPEPGGMNTESDPASIKPWEFVSLVNADLRGNNVVPRPGLSKVNPSALHTITARHHPTQFEFGTPFRLWLKGDGCPGESAGTGFYVGHFDFDQEPQYQRASWFDFATTSINISSYGGVPYVGVDDTLYRQQLIPVPYGTEALGLAGAPAVQVATFPGFVIRGMKEFDGLFFILLDGGAGASKVARYDGRTMNDGTNGTTADLTGIDPPIAAGVWHDNLVLGFAVGSAQIRLRARGATPSWTNVAAPGIGTSPGGNSIVSYKGVVYGASGSTYLWSYNGLGAPAGAHSPASATLVESLAVSQDALGDQYLIYGYATATAARIGRYDGSVFTDAHKDFTVQVSSARRVKGLAWFKSQLGAAVNTTTFGGKVFLSPGRDTAGTYEVFTPDPTTNGDIHQLEVI